MQMEGTLPTQQQIKTKCGPNTTWPTVNTNVWRVGGEITAGINLKKKMAWDGYFR